ncbi:hypothetical protein [Streptomyces aquilus]|uniref:hypothetical protein n=1 Tax=Streptomyces aquilus TaxID=2548456 RepID=UPI003698C814
MVDASISPLSFSGRDTVCRDTPTARATATGFTAQVVAVDGPHDRDGEDDRRLTTVTLDHPLPPAVIPEHWVAENVTATANTFLRPSTPAILIAPANTELDPAHPVHRNVTISGNVFEDARAPVVRARSVGGLAVYGNHLTGAAADLQENPVAVGLVGTVDTDRCPVNLDQGDLVTPVELTAQTRTPITGGESAEGRAV